ncbi:hypothetical protein ACE6H2_007570 [Prunus campanulata]
MNMEPPMCAKGCGFYGCVENKNMCSKCYKDHVKQENLNARSTTVASSEEETDLGSIARGISLLSFQTSDDSVSNTNTSNIDNNSGSKKNRCESCNRKVGVLGFECRCGGVFCGKHRYPETHSCNLDLKKAGREVLAKQNPLCKGDKLQCRI